MKKARKPNSANNNKHNICIKPQKEIVPLNDYQSFHAELLAIELEVTKEIDLLIANNSTLTSPEFNEYLQALQAKHQVPQRFLKVIDKYKNKMNQQFIQLLQQQYDIDILLHYAFKDFGCSLAEFLLNNGAKVGKNLIFYALASSAEVFELVRLAVRSGAEVNSIAGNGCSPLLALMMEPLNNRDEHIKTVEFLLQNGANPNLESENHVVALDLAIQGQDKPIVQLLLQYGADITKSKAAVSIAGSISQALNLKTKASIAEEIENIILNTKLLFIINKGEECSIKSLIKKGAIINAKYNGQTPLHKSLMAGGNYLMVSTFINHGADLTLLDANGANVLDLAILSADKRLVKLVLDSGADIAKSQEAQKIIAEELEFAAQFNADMETQIYYLFHASNYRLYPIEISESAVKDIICFTDLLFKLDKDYHAYIKFFIYLGASINAKKNGQTFLHEAASEGYPFMVCTLLENGANFLMLKV